MRFRVLAAVCLAALGAVTLSCGKEGSSKEILVGEYGSLTGGIATFGISTRDGSQLAFDDINQKGLILGQNNKLLVEDDQSKPEDVDTEKTVVAGDVARFGGFERLHAGHDVDHRLRGKAGDGSAADVLNRPNEPCCQRFTKGVRFLSKSCRPRRIVGNDLNRRFERRHSGESANSIMV